MFYHITSIYPNVRIKFSFVQFSLLCYEFSILSKIESTSIYYHFRRDHESSSFRKLARNKWICWEICDFVRYQFTLLTINSKLWVSSFFQKRSKFDVNFKKGAKYWGKVFVFLDNCIRIVSYKLSLLQREYLWSAVMSHMLTNIAKISDMSKTDFSQHYFPESYEKIW